LPEPDVLILTPGGEDLARLYPWLDERAAARRLPKPMLHGMHVALEEAAANAAMHGFPDEIQVRLCCSDAAATLVVEDNGRAFDPTVVSPAARPASLAETKPGGLGLMLLRHYCADVNYERAGARNRLTLRFPLPA